jgi:hypothetical protein
VLQGTNEVAMGGEAKYRKRIVSEGGNDPGPKGVKNIGRRGDAAVCPKSPQAAERRALVEAFMGMGFAIKGGG